MLRSYNSNQNQYQYSWDKTTPYEYHEHMSIIESSPGVLPDVSRYVNAQMLFNKKVAYEEERGRPVHPYEKIQACAAHKKVHFVENEKITDVDKNMKHEVHEERSVDAEADGFIKQKHKNFELAKWATFNQV